MIRELLKGRLLGHPVHAMLIHFPTALFISSFVFDISGLYGLDRSLFSASFYSIGLGLAGGVIAGVFGVIDYIRLAENSRKDVLIKASWHGAIQLTVLMLFGVVFGLRFNTLYSVVEPRSFEMLISGVGLLFMLVGNYLGGDMVFREGIAVCRSQNRDDQVDFTKQETKSEK